MTVTRETDPDWHLELILLGIGGAFDVDRGVANTGALLELHEPGEPVSRVLIDCGHTCGRQLAKLDLSYKDIDAVLVTHAHGDHIDGLEVVGYKSLFLLQHRVEIITKQPVLDQIWTSLAPKMGRLQTSSDESEPATLDTYFSTAPVEGDTVSLFDDRVTARFIPVRHVHMMPAFALIFELSSGDKRGPIVRWSGDTTFKEDSPLFEDLQPDLGDLIFHDCLFGPFYEATVHTHFSSLCELPEQLRRHIVLIHHGQIQDSRSRREGMLLGQPFDRFTFHPSGSKDSSE